MVDGATQSFQQAYTAQAGVDSQAQIIVAAEITQAANDQQQLVPMLKPVQENLGRMPAQASADTGYFSEAAVTDPQLQGVDLVVPPDRQKHGGREASPAVPGEAGSAPPAAPIQKSVADRMREKIRGPEGQALYQTRKAVVEPVLGQLKQCRGFRSLLPRGLGKVKAEWKIICMCHNLPKLYPAQVCLAAT
jgi:Transposase DDE domain